MGDVQTVRAPAAGNKVQQFPLFYVLVLTQSVEYYHSDRERGALSVEHDINADYIIHLFNRNHIHPDNGRMKKRFSRFKKRKKRRKKGFLTPRPHVSVPVNMDGITGERVNNVESNSHQPANQQTETDGSTSLCPLRHWFLLRSSALLRFYGRLAFRSAFALDSYAGWLLENCVADFSRTERNRHGPRRGDSFSTNINSHPSPPSPISSRLVLFGARST